MRWVVLAVVGLSGCSTGSAQPPPTPASEGSGAATAPDPGQLGVPDLGEGWLGVALEQIDAAEALTLGLEGPRVRVSQVFPLTPAAASDFAANDLLLRFDDHDLTDTSDLIARTRATRPGTIVNFTLRRGHETLVQPVMLGMRPELDELLVSLFVGQPAPPLSALILADDSAVALADGEIAVIDFWATWCGPCRRALPSLNALHARYGPLGVRFIGVSSEEPQVLRDFLATTAIDYTVAYDPEQATSQSYFITAYPTLFLVDASRTVRRVLVGGNDLPALEISLQALLRERAAQ